MRISYQLLSVLDAKGHMSSFPCGPLKAPQTWLEMRGKHLSLYPPRGPLLPMERYLALCFGASVKNLSVYSQLR